MAGGRIRRRLHLNNIYAFTCRKSTFQEDHSQIGGPGFSRVVYCNEPNSPAAERRSYAGNYVRSTKYTPASFVPKTLFEQFRRVANFYFLVTGILSLTPLSPYGPVSALLPLGLVIAASMRQDIEVNNRKVKVHGGDDGMFREEEWRDLRVGDVVRVEKDEFFPADLLLLSSSYEDSVCYVETMNLDGETNLKVKQGLEATSSRLHEDSDFKEFKAVVRCEDPNADLYTFVGTLHLEEQRLPLSVQQLLLRDSKLRNTEYVYGAVVFTGHDTKVIQNSTDPPSKRSRIERKMDKIIYMMFGVVFLMSFIGSIIFGIETREDRVRNIERTDRWYLKPDDAEIFFDPERAPMAAIYHFLTAVMLYSYFIPISLYVSIEIVKVLQSIFINNDILMYYEETDKPAHARTSNLNEELGMVDTVLSDKTGTLTCNSMEFIKCSIAGTAYGRGVTEVERSMAMRSGGSVLADDDVVDRSGPKIKGFNFQDERVMKGNWVKEREAAVLQKFFRLLAVCHTAIPETDEATGTVSYEAESPDEAAFVVAAREFGFEFFSRTQNGISIRELDLGTGQKVERFVFFCYLCGFLEVKEMNIPLFCNRVYRLLNVLEFNSTRKRMSVIVRDEDGKILLLSKGADNVMFERLAKDGRKFEEKTREHVNEYADAGLRTLILAYRELDENEYVKFSKNFNEAKSSVTEDRQSLIDEITDQMERDLILLGATAVEDKLQNGVPDCIDKLAQAGIKIWVLTGDKMETSINIGQGTFVMFACSLLRQEMKQIIINLETPNIKALEKAGEKDVIEQASRESVVKQMEEGKSLITTGPSGTDSHDHEAFALIIDGKSLTYALEDDFKNKFLDLATGCASVICCRSSPKQKALVTRLVKSGTGKTTLAIGDGANDVGMLQEADIGVGISGVEGMQAVMSSDIAIAQFRYLERLLLVHGHWCYSRISSMICYFFYKNITFGVTLFLYEAYTSFSAQPAYNDWFLSLFNVFFSSLPVIALGVFDQDVSARFCYKFPLLYQEGVQNLLFSWKRIIGWMFNGLISALAIFFICKQSQEHQLYNPNGKTAGRDILAGTMYTCVVWVVNLQMVLAISYFTWVQHIVIWGSVALWYIFLMIYGAITPTFSTDAYKVFLEALAPAPSYWLTTLLVMIFALVPYFVFKSVQMRYFPGYHQMIQWIRHEGQSNDPEFVEMVRQRSIRTTTVGSTARRAASVRRSGRFHDQLNKNTIAISREEK
ncbi:hypothetical protein Bca52824_062544 [Brassica carinata]|uniref:Phospholipid-transporting ATPase n=1 Tax=Brassica carinata TaxID=52824 RepID=A0A8X7U7D3_BRACI|nr:hypothetical protein Bca52824_062544 [Brassica carinata]